MSATNIDSGDIPSHLGRRATHNEARIAVVPRRVPLECQRPGVAVINEPLLIVRKRNGVADDMVRRRVVRDAQLEAVAVALERAEAPAVVAVAPGVDLLDGDGGREHVEVEAVVDVVPEPGVAQHVAIALALLAREAVGALAVLARVAVAVRVEVQDGVVGRGALELEARLVVVVCRQTVVVVVGGVASVDAVRAVD